MGLFDDLQPQDPDSPFADQQVSDIASDNGDPKTRALANQVLGMEKNVSNAGYSPDVGEPRTSLFSDILDTLDAPRQGVAGLIDTALRGDAFTTDPTTGEDVGTGWRRGQKENTTTADILNRNDIISNPIARGIAGFAGDVITDPLTWLSLGTGDAIKVGGKALTEDGVALRNLASERLIAGGVTDDFARDAQLTNAFESASAYQDHAANLAKLTADGDADGFAAANEADLMAKHQDAFTGTLTPEEVAGNNLFEKQKLHVGMKIPLLGNIFGADEAASTEILQEDPGPVGQALRIAGKIWTPANIKIADIGISPAVANAMDNIRLYTNAKLTDMGNMATSAINAAEKIPVLGSAVTAGKAVASKASELLGQANTAFKDTFLQKSILGADANNTRLDFINTRAANKHAAQSYVANMLGDDLLADKATQKEAYLAIDAQANTALKQTIPETDKDVLDLVNNFKAAPTLDAINDGDRIALGQKFDQYGSDQVFNTGIQNLLASPELDPKLKDAITRTVSGMDSLAQQESAAGINYSRLQAYVPHRYQTLGTMEAATKPLAGGADAAFFTKQRKYDTIGDAFKQSGLVGDTDLATMLQHRVNRSLDLQNTNNFWKRITLEKGMSPDLVTGIYKEAQLDPSGSAAQALKRYRINLDPVNENLVREGADNAAKQEVYKKLGQGGDIDAAKEVVDGQADVAQKVNEELWSAGQAPLDHLLPEPNLGELGDIVKDGNGKEMFLPKPIADSVKETIAARDYVKDFAAKSPLTKSMLNMMDTGTDFFKRLMTLPFPAFWGHRMVGSRFQQMLVGGAASYDPGILGRTFSVLGGKGAIKNEAGMLLDKPLLERVIKNFGLSYSTDDFLGTVDSLGKMNVGKYLAQKQNSLFENLAKFGTKDNRLAAYAQASDQFDKGFDGMQRVVQFVHRFEKGDSIADAVRSSNEMYFNYRDLSPTEQSVFKRFYMFYGHMSKATKQSLTQLVTNPGALTGQLHGVNALSEMFSDNSVPTVEQSESKLLNSVVTNEEISRRVGTNPDTGAPIIARGFAAPLNLTMRQFTLESPRNFSVGELMDTAGDSLRRTIQKQFAAANPLINTMAQAVSGKNLYFDAPLTSNFMRKLPSLNAAAESLAGYQHDQLPIDLDAPAKAFLDAVPDGKGRLIANPTKMWMLMNLVPGLSRAVSTGGAITNTEVPTSAKVLRTVLGANLDDQDPSRSYLSKKIDQLLKFMYDYSVKQREKNADNDSEEDGFNGNSTQ